MLENKIFADLCFGQPSFMAVQLSSCPVCDVSCWKRVWSWSKVILGRLLCICCLCINCTQLGLLIRIAPNIFLLNIVQWTILSTFCFTQWINSDMGLQAGNRWLSLFEHFRDIHVFVCMLFAFSNNDSLSLQCWDLSTSLHACVHIVHVRDGTQNTFHVSGAC